MAGKEEPKDLFPVNKLHEILNICITTTNI